MKKIFLKLKSYRLELCCFTEKGFYHEQQLKELDGSRNMQERDEEERRKKKHDNNLQNIIMCGALGDLVSFMQFEKREKHPWRNINFSKVAGLKLATLLKLTLLYGCFLRSLNCTNGTKSRNA